VLEDAVVSAEDAAALDGPARRITLSRLLFPGPTAEYETSLATYGDISALPSSAFFFGLQHGEELAVDLGPGVQLLFGLEAVGDADERGMRNVVCTLNGQLRPLSVRDRSLLRDTPAAERANPDDPNEVGAPFTGVATLRVSRGQRVDAGEVVATIEAMKMEASVTTSVAGTVEHIAVERVAQVQAGDLLLRLR
jgi:pyruvate carboxylase